MLDMQIKTAYEKEQMTPEQIAEDTGFELGAIKAKLMQVSSVYRKACGQADEEDETLNFSNDDLRMVNHHLMNLALSAEHEPTRLKALMYIRDDKKGRREVNKAVAGTTFNILQLNETMQKARLGAESARRIVDIKAA